MSSLYKETALLLLDHFFLYCLVSYILELFSHYMHSQTRVKIKPRLSFPLDEGRPNRRVLNYLDIYYLSRVPSDMDYCTCTVHITPIFLLTVVWEYR